MNHPEQDELDSHLLQLAFLAQQHPPRSPGRQIALTKLVNGIMRSGRLCHPQKSQYPVAVYENIYDEARQELLLYICEKIDKYDAERGSVMAWVNVLFERRFFKDAIRKIQTQQGIQRINVADLDNVIALPQEPKTLTDILKECIESDPEDIFKNEHIEKCPQANFQALATRRMLGKSWKEISAEFEIKIPTVSSFYYRCVNKFSSKLKEYCVNDVN
ncbi:MAG: sigma-70 family RNA polymerase sigma factor [Mojavia pulchra JT2-VF2]|jgi:DNA-directed RNA polymerase specialized sigma24 family protein|uniref:Sigma-70 family RNA polymerase sigma factor n=1 Tax=Mojavia pulchra JT2-VF2 TaxID=287848 RepID=A0A951Q1G0_9NOST|nr:sigma-70 family RNA polymerase sigma factor [Mojavia pulchra JT2-VF2]